jgi:hypothetical protein
LFCGLSFGTYSRPHLNSFQVSGSVKQATQKLDQKLVTSYLQVGSSLPKLVPFSESHTRGHVRVELF